MDFSSRTAPSPGETLLRLLTSQSLTAPESIDWTAARDLATAHGVLAQIDDALKRSTVSVPPGERKVFSELRALNARRNLRAAGALLRLLEGFEARGIPALPLKGPWLAERAHGDLALRQFTDLDILVRAADLAAAGQVLEGSGYRPEQAFSPRQTAANFRQGCETTYVGHDQRQLIDLHWMVSVPHEPWRLDTESLFERAVEGSLCGRKIRVPSPEDTVLHLCLHGSRDLWSRLAALCDLRAALGMRPAWDWGELLALAERAKLRRILLLGLCLLRDTMGVEPSPAILEAAREDRGLERLRIRMLNRFHQSLRGREWSALAEGVAQIRLHESLPSRARWLLARSVMPTPADWSRIRLPDSLYSLYYILRPFRLALSAAQRGMRPLRP